jgi:hypothetical protein
MASFTAAATSYATHGQPMIPFYIFYSMFGFQRTGDQLWAAADQMSRGFVLGATAGRTTLNGEGLQHEDGPQPPARDDGPALPGVRRRLRVRARSHHRRWPAPHVRREREHLLLHHAPERELRDAAHARGANPGFWAGLYRFRPAEKRLDRHVQLFGSGSHPALGARAQKLLAERFGVSSDVWSVTSYQTCAPTRSLASAGIVCTRTRSSACRSSSGAAGVEGPFITASDYMKSLGDLIARWCPAHRAARHRRLRHERLARGPAPPLRGRRGERVIAALDGLGSRARPAPTRSREPFASWASIQARSNPRRSDAELARDRRFDGGVGGQVRHQRCARTRVEPHGSVAYAYPRRFFAHLRGSGQLGGPRAVAIGGDLRPSTGRIVTAVAKAASDAGLAVVHGGRVPSPALALYGQAQGCPRSW